MNDIRINPKTENESQMLESILGAFSNQRGNIFPFTTTRKSRMYEIYNKRDFNKIYKANNKITFMLKPSMNFNFFLHHIDFLHQRWHRSL